MSLVSTCNNGFAILRPLGPPTLTPWLKSLARISSSLSAVRQSSWTSGATVSTPAISLSNHASNRSPSPPGRRRGIRSGLWGSVLITHISFSLIGLGVCLLSRAEHGHARPDCRLLPHLPRPASVGPSGPSRSQWFSILSKWCPAHAVSHTQPAWLTCALGIYTGTTGTTPEYTRLKLGPTLGPILGPTLGPLPRSQAIT